MSPRSVGRLVPAILFLLSACTFGEWNEVARVSPFGLEARFVARGEEYVGELLTADREGVLVLVDGEPLSAAWSAMASFQLVELGSVRVTDGVLPSAENLERARLAARYPFGLTDEQLAEVRRTSEWREVRRIAR